jgi:FkbM family methyltransferase
LVSSDFSTTTVPCIIDAKSCIDIGNGKFKLMIWYDNEWSYSTQIIRLLKHINEYKQNKYITNTSIPLNHFIENMNFYDKRVICRFDYNVAISNKSGTAKIYYLPDEIISIHNLPTWLRGCSSVGVKHKSAEQELSKRNLSSDLIQHKDIDIITFSELCSKHNIESIDNLKIDTEGHEQYILPDVLAKVKQGLLINHIKFENQQYLGNQILLNIIRDEFVKLNYKLVEQTDCDVLLERII